jgi:lysozyme
LLWTTAVGHVIDPSHIAVKYEDRKNLPIPDGWDRQLSMGEVDAVNHQGQFDALVSFAFNVGLGNLQRSSIRMRYNRGDIEGAADAFLMWTKAAGRVLPGLVKRRQDERAMFLARLGSS